MSIQEKIDRVRGKLQENTFLSPKSSNLYDIVSRSIEANRDGFVGVGIMQSYLYGIDRALGWYKKVRDKPEIVDMLESLKMRVKAKVNRSFTGVGKEIIWDDLKFAVKEILVNRAAAGKGDEIDRRRDTEVGDFENAIRHTYLEIKRAVEDKDEEDVNTDTLRTVRSSLSDIAREMF